MKISFNDNLIAYFTLISGLAISGVAEYYSIMGLIAIYPAALIPIVIMGIVLGLGKISGTVWLKQNWKHSPWLLKAYILPALAIIMMITSIGVFGYLSKAHSDQNLVSGDVQAKIAVYDEKIKTSKENIDANRKALKQMDEAVDQVMGRSQDEKGADKAVALRRGQAKERTRLLSEITAEQKTITQLSEERAPIAAEVRKVEAEVGPIKYIAAFIYGDNPDTNLLERAVTWVTVLIVVVLDPLALVLLLASQYSFQRIRELKDKNEKEDTPDPYVADVGEKPTEEEKKTTNDFVPQPQEYIPDAEGDSPEKESDVVSTATVTNDVIVLNIDGGKFETKPSTVDYKILDDVSEVDYLSPIERNEYVQNEEQRDSNLWSNTIKNNLSQQEYIQASQERLENHIDEIAELVKSGHLNIEEVPKTVREQVRVKLNAG
jgi:energy-converting hydrogenase Eha subunit A